MFSIGIHLSQLMVAGVTKKHCCFPSIALVFFMRFCYCLKLKFRCENLSLFLNLKIRYQNNTNNNMLYITCKYTHITYIL